ncbi:MAG: bifunctional UDP-N-acetylglucosamine diphosphorylase/glucosamine-1-phosphate N-acetyltransferase GlmU [Candidatus Dormibacteria bacterium]
MTSLGAGNFVYSHHMVPMSLRAVILAAGQGSRLRSSTPKVLHALAGRTILSYVVDTAREVSTEQPLVVVHLSHAEVREHVQSLGGIPVLQQESRGTGDAVRSVPEEFWKADTFVILSGDTPLVTAATVRMMIEQHERTGDAATVATFRLRGKNTYGRIEHDDATGAVCGIREARDRGEETGNDEFEYNAGLYCFATGPLKQALKKLTPDNAQGEYYLSDVIGLLVPEGVGTYVLDDAEELAGINDHKDFARVEHAMRRRIADRLMEKGVHITDPATTYCDWEVDIEPGTTIQPGCVLRGRTKIGRDCMIGPYAQLRDMTVGDGCTVGSSTLEESTLGAFVTIGQYCRVRAGCTIGNHVYLGTAAEVKNAEIGERSFISHFSCVLDARVGSNVNVGAGTVTCNFDGISKHRTIMGDGAFIGSDSILVAPCVIGKHAYVGAGSVITHDVPDDALAVERNQQQNVEGWALRHRAHMSIQETGASPTTPPLEPSS